MEAIDKIREAGLKLTPQRKAVYEAMMELRHAPIEAIISCVQSKDKEITLSTVYRILDSFYKASNPQLSSSASFLRLNVLSSLN